MGLLLILLGWWHDSLSWCFRCKVRFVAVLFPLEVALVSGRPLGGLLLPTPDSSSVTSPSMGQSLLSG